MFEEMKDELERYKEKIIFSFNSIWTVLFVSLPLDFLLTKEIVSKFVNQEILLFIETLYLLIALTGIGLTFVDFDFIKSFFNNLSELNLKNKKNLIIWIVISLFALLGFIIVSIAFLSNLGFGIFMPLIICVSGIASLIQTLKNQNAQDNFEKKSKKFELKSVILILFVLFFLNFRFLHFVGVIIVLHHGWSFYYLILNYLVCFGFFFYLKNLNVEID